MQKPIVATPEVVSRYLAIFVNRGAYTVQSLRPKSGTDRHYYYRPQSRDGKPIPLSTATLRKHLEGEITIALYAINPRSQRCKWVAIDADYPDALEHLLHLQWELRQDGIEAGLENSRRGGHLWIFAAEPLLARDCRLYILNLAKRLQVPVKGSGQGEGIELFPKQDSVPAGEFGNALRAPLGIHRATDKRYWFYGADYSLESQLGYLSRLKRVTEAEMKRFAVALNMPEQMERNTTPKRICYRPGNPNAREFRILDYVTAKKKSGRNYWARCPSCALQGRDQGGDNLAIAVADSHFYRCWAGCSKEDIRAALGYPIPASGRRFA